MKTFICFVLISLLPFIACQALPSNICTNAECCRLASNPNPTTGDGYLEFNGQCLTVTEALHCVDRTGCILCHSPNVTVNQFNRPICDDGALAPLPTCSNQSCCDSLMSPNPATGYGFLQFSNTCLNGGANCVDGSGCLDCFNAAVTSAANTLGRPVCGTAVSVQTAAPVLTTTAVVPATTAVPVTTVATTAVPVTTVTVPATATTQVPVTTVTVPVIATTEVPVATVTVPVVVTTQVPVATVTVPVVVTTEPPVFTTEIVETVVATTLPVTTFQTSQPSIFTAQEVSTFLVQTSQSDGYTLVPAITLLFSVVAIILV